MKKKIRNALITFIIIILLLLIAKVAVEKNAPVRVEDIRSMDDITTIRLAVEYSGCEYIREKKSEDKDFNKDIYIKLGKDLYTGDTKNKMFFTQLVKYVAKGNNYLNFRLADEEKKILIAVICEDGKILKTYINGDNNYYRNEDSRRALANYVDIIPLDININSYDTDSTNVEVKKIQGKVFNAVFNKEYDEEILDGITTGTSLEEVKQVLGTPHFYDEYKNVIGYKLTNNYIFFSDANISVYGNYEYDYVEFENLIAKFQEDFDIKSFVSGITDIWLDYDYYRYNSNYVELVYTLKGIKIQFGNVNNNGVTIYNNYKGEIKEMQNGVHLEIDKDFVFEYELKKHR